MLSSLRNPNKKKKNVYLILSNIKPEMVQELVKMGPSPPPIVFNILKAVMVTQKKPETWDAILDQLRDYALIGKLMEITPQSLDD